MKLQAKRCAHIAAGIALRLLAAVIAGTILLTAVYALPRGPIQKNVAASAALFDESETYPSIFGWCTSQLDNFTDALMLLEAAHADDESALLQAMRVSHDAILDLTPDQVLARHFIDGVAYDQSGGYARYWHGYQLFLTPLLMFLNLSRIRALNGACQLIIVLAILALLVRKRMGHLAPPFLICYLLLMPLALARCLQFSTCFYTLSFASIAVLLKKDSVVRFRRWLYLFTWIGIATSYVDFLTYPLATFGIPAVIWLAAQDRPAIKQTLLRLFGLLACWGIGYVGMWASKWIIGTLITSENVLADAGGVLATRSSCESVLQLLITIYRNVRLFLRTPASLIAGLYCLAICVCIFRACRKPGTDLRPLRKIALPYLLIALLPLAWYMGTTNHSFIHRWFTNKAVVVSAFSGMAMLAQLRHALPSLPHKEPER